MTVQELRNIIEQRKGKRDQIKQQLSFTAQRLKDNKRRARRHEQAKEIIRVVGLRTQQQLQYHIGDITSLALEAVYDDPYQLVAEFVQRRNKTECDLYFTRNDDKIDPLTAAGGGVVNIAAFALRVASWSMQQPRSNNVLILDEPFGNVASDLLPHVSEMLLEITRRLKLQLIMVTHSELLQAAADRTFTVQIKRGVTSITTGK